MNRRDFIKAMATYAKMAALTGPSLQEFFYYAWSWKKWRRFTGAHPVSVRSAQAGKAELVNLLWSNGKVIRSLKEWQKKRMEIRQLLLTFFGDFPQQTSWLNPRILQEREFHRFIRRKIAFQVEAQDVVTAYLFIPREGRPPYPAVLCPHQTTPFGKQEPAGIKGDPRLALARKLAERGYVTLAADAICFGERHNPLLGHYGEALAFYRKHPRWSVAGKMVWDKSRAIDFLISQDFVDANRIGAIGHSHGGYGSLQAAAFDERIRCIAANGAFTLFRADGNTFRWSHATPLLPLLGFYLGGREMTWENFQNFKLSEVNEVPFDWHHILALIAPRPLFLSFALDDPVFPHADRIRDELVPRVQPIYALFGAETQFKIQFFHGGHHYPETMQETAFDWLDQWLKPENP